ncbi:MAG TPA: hypothetical protein VEJ63_16300 [Planctomycetota bacterium]|nr:hypothetical protein [Planctomycetota bacterium]
MMVRTVLAMLAMFSPLAFSAETIKIPVTRDTWISSTGAEVDTNMGKAPRLKLKGYQEYALLDFDSTPLKGKKITSATLHVAYAEGRKNAPEARGTDLRWFTVSTISSPWEEGLGTNYTIDGDGNGATFNEAAFEKRRWAHAGSKNWDVTLGNGHSLRCDVDGGDPKDGWFTIPLHKRLIEALAAGAGHGLLLMDGSVFISTNSFIYSLEGGKGAYLNVTVDGEDQTAPAAPADIEIQPSPNDASGSTGAAWVTFTVPQDAFTYTISVNGKALPRWQIPFAEKPGTKQRFLLEYLPPDAEFKLDVATLDACGNASAPTSVKGKASPAISVPALPRSAWLPKGGEVPTLGGKLKVWAFPEISKLDPISGKILQEKFMENAAKRNSVWDAAGPQVRLVAARGEIAGVQLAVELNGNEQSGNVKTRVEGLKDVSVKLWRTWFVNIGGKWQADYAIPLKESDALVIPTADNKIPGQRAAVIAIDLIVSPNATAGEQTGTIVLSSEGVGELKLPLKLNIANVTIPAETNFMPELNCYGGPLGAAGSEPFLDAFRIAHYHRCVINRVPHSHNGRTHEDWIPKAGPDGKITDWTNFDRNLGPLLDGSAFKNNPRAGVPTPVLYLPFNESWPLPIGPHYKPGENVPLIGENWRQKHDIVAKPPEEAFTPEYKAAFVNAVKDFVTHAEEKKWNRTLLQCYNNNKVQYGKRDLLDENGQPVMKDGKKVQVPGMSGTAWTLDEPQTWLDWQALLFYSRLFHKGLDEAKTTKFVYRGDISRPMWQGNCFDGLMEVMVSPGNQFDMNPLMKAHKRRMPTKLWAYGGCNSQDKANHQTTTWCLKAYVHECDGVLPWQSIGGDDAFEKGDGDGGNGNMLIVDGKRFGVNAIASFRVHAFRNGAQICELLRLLELKNGWGRAQSAALVNQLIPLHSEFKQKFADDAAALKFEDVNGDIFVQLKEGIIELLQK